MCTKKNSFRNLEKKLKFTRLENKKKLHLKNKNRICFSHPPTPTHTQTLTAFLLDGLHEIVDLFEAGVEPRRVRQRPLLVLDDAHDLEEVVVAGATLALSLLAAQVNASHIARHHQTGAYYLAELLQYYFDAVRTDLHVA
jgi:hypothetical protein